MAKKTKEVTDVNEAMSRLGINSVEAPGGGELDTSIVEPKEQAVQKEPAQSVEQPSIEMVEEEGQVVSDTQDEQGNLTEEEKQRRTWQAQADQAKAELAKRDEQIRQMQEQTRQLLNVVSPLMQKYNPQPEVQKANEPPKADYIVDGYFDQEKHSEWQQRHDEWLLSQAENRITSSWQKRQGEEKTEDELVKIGAEFPEFVNPFTGETDKNRVYNFVQNYTKGKTLTDLVREAKGISAAKMPKKPDAFGSQDSLSAIERNANKPQPVVGSETETKEIEVPDEIKQLQKIFGKIDLPEGFDGIKK